MSVAAIICLSGIVAAFVSFAVVLAWGDYQTRDLGPARPSDGGSPRDIEAGVARLREIAEEAKEPIHAA